MRRLVERVKRWRQQKRVWKPSEGRTGLKLKIIRRTSVIMILAMTVSTLGAYAYFADIVRKQALRDEELRLEQFAAQISFMVEDLITFSRNIVVDDVIQQTAKEKSYDSEIEKVRANKRVGDRLIFYNSMRNYIVVATIIDQYGRGYSSRGFYEEQYFDDKLHQKEIVEYEAAPEKVFSAPYIAKEAEIKDDVICYKTVIRDIEHSESVIGSLYMEIDLSYFERQVDQYAQNYEKVIWCSSDGTVLYDSNESAFQSARPQKGAESVQRVAGGYQVSCAVEGTDWLIGGYVSKNYLRQQSGNVLLFFIGFYCITLFGMILCINPVIDAITRPITALTKVMRKARQKEFHVDMGTSDILEIEALYHGFNRMMEEIDGYAREIIQHENQEKEMEFDIMLSQINPHYLYNVLNTVVYLAADADNYEIVGLVNALIGTLQENLKVGENNIYTTVEKELEVVKSYLTIQNYRYPDMMSVEYQVEERLMGCQIPKTIIQPLVDNSLIHGIIPSEEPGNIWIRVKTLDENLVIEVEDDGAGMVEEIKARFDAGEELVYKKGERKHIGLQNIRSRISFLYKDKASMAITHGRDGKGTMVTITIPKNI